MTGNVKLIGSGHQLMISGQSAYMDVVAAAVGLKAALLFCIKVDLLAGGYLKESAA